MSPGSVGRRLGGGRRSPPAREPPDGSHLDGVEGFCSFGKIWLYHCRGVPRHYFPRYLEEIEVRFDRRDEDLDPVPARYTVNPVPTV